MLTFKLSTLLMCLLFERVEIRTVTENIPLRTKLLRLFIIACFLI